MASDFDERVTPSNRVDVICYGCASSPHVNMILSIQNKQKTNSILKDVKNSFVVHVGTTQLKPKTVDCRHRQLGYFLYQAKNMN